MRSSTSQLARADAIRTLRSLDVPLAAIATVLDDGNPDIVLTSHLVELESQRDEIARRSALLRRLLETKELLMPDSVTLKVIPPQRVVPVATPIVEVDGVENEEVPGGPVAAIVHRGAYEDMGASYATIGTWVHEHGHRTVGPAREIYLNSPTDVGTAELLTEIQWPIDDDGGSVG